MILILLHMACLNIERFEKRYAADFCQYANECEVLDLEGFSTMKACESEVTILPEVCDELDQKQARKCLKKTSVMSCEDGQSGQPKACNNLCG